MKKIIKIGFPIVCIVIVGGTIIAINNLKNKAENISNNVKNETSFTYKNVEDTNKYTTNLAQNTIQNVVNEAALQVAKANRDTLEVADFEYALEKVIMWPEKKVKSMKEKEKKLVAYHELWHAVTGHLLENTDPIEKISSVL